MYYRHQLNYSYPEKSDQHMITVKHLRDVELDEHYPYLQKGFWYGCKRVLLQILLYGVMSWLLPLVHGLRIHGRDNLKKHKELLQNGAITIANHVYMLDYASIMRAVRPRLMVFPAWKTNLEGPNGMWIRMSGGIPVPTESFRAMAAFKRAMEEAFAQKKWVHFFPEGSLWFYYPDVRPFKKAVFQYAVQYQRPILPLAFTFRPRRGITAWFAKTPFVDLHIGEPLVADASLPKKQAVEELHARAYHVMQEMCGIHPGDPTYNTNQNIEEYQKTM